MNSFCNTTYGGWNPADGVQGMMIDAKAAGYSTLLSVAEDQGRAYTKFVDGNARLTGEAIYNLYMDGKAFLRYRAGAGGKEIKAFVRILCSAIRRTAKNHWSQGFEDKWSLA